MRIALVLPLGLAASLPALGQAAWPVISTPPAGPIQQLLSEWRFREAEPIARDLLRRAEARTGPDSIDTAAAIDVLVEVLLFKREGNNPELEALARRALSIREAAQGPNHPDLARSLHILGAALFNAGRYREARPLHARALKIREAAFGPDHPSVADSLDRYLWSLLFGYTYDPQVKKSGIDILALARRALDMKEKAYGPEHPEVARSLDNLAYEHLNRQEVDTARTLHERALAIREAALGPNHPEIAMSLVFVGFVQYALGENSLSNTLYERALAIRSKVLGAEHVEVGWSLEEIAIGYEIEGRYTEALPLLEQAARIRERELGTSHPEYAWNQHNLGVYHYTTGDYARAAPYFERAIATARRVLPSDDIFADISEWSYALLLFGVGDYTAAEPIFERARAKIEEYHGSDHYVVVQGLGLYTRLLHRLGRHREAIEGSERAVRIMEQTKGPKHFRVGFELQALASILAEAGDPGRARELAERSMSILEESLGPENDRAGLNLETLGILSLKAGRHVEARALFQRAVALKEKTFGGRHPEVAATLSCLARALRALGETEPAFQAALRAEDIGRGHLKLGARALPERQALTYAGVRAAGLDLALSIAADDPGAGRPRRALDSLVRSRALVLDEVARSHRTATGSGDPEIRRLSEELSSSRARLANISSRGVADGSSAQYRRLLADLTAQKERAERALVRRSSAFREEIAEREAGLEEVMAALQPGTVLLSYLRYPRSAAGAKKPAAGPPAAPAAAADGSRSTAKGQPSYVALVSDRLKPDPILVPLGNAKSIDSLIGEWRESLSTPPRGSRSARSRSEAASREVGKRLRKAIWDPVAGALGGAPQVVIVPDGAIHLVNFAALPTGADRYLLEAGPLLHYLSAERDLVKTAREQKRGTGSLVIGGPAFDADPGLVAAEGLVLAGASPGGASLAQGQEVEVYRGATAECEDFRSLRFAPLPAALDEVEEISAQLAGTPAYRGTVEEGVLMLTGPAAGEAAFKRLASGRRMVHVATHGFSLQGRCGIDLGTPASRPDNPLLLSGLALAGANRREQVKPETELEDGILTAEEIGSLDLSGVDWVVLSGCETGLGDVQAGEGVLGLRRAFQVAGARTLITSLWPVQDDSTREWMGGLYRSRQEGKTTAESVRSASLEMLSKRRAQGKSTHPFYWGAFVAAGDSR